VGLSAQAALYIDLRLPSGVGSAPADRNTGAYVMTVPAGTSSVSMELWARVEGTDTNQANESFQSVWTELLSSVNGGTAAGKAFNGNLSYVSFLPTYATLNAASAPIGAASGNKGTSPSIDVSVPTDGVGDMGAIVQNAHLNANLTTSKAYFIQARAAAQVAGGGAATSDYGPSPVNPTTGWQFKIGTVEFQNIVASSTEAGAYTMFSPFVFMGPTTSFTTSGYIEDGVIKKGVINQSTATGDNRVGTSVMFIQPTGPVTDVSYAMQSAVNSGKALNTKGQVLDGFGAEANKPVFTQWFSPAEKPGSMVGFISPTPSLISDVVEVSGSTSELYLLEMSYDTSIWPSEGAEVGAANAGHIQLAILKGGTWSPASPTKPMELGAAPDYPNDAAIPASELGRWGVDTANNMVWQVVDQRGTYAVVPEPATIGLLGLSALGLTIRRRRNA